jgi:TfoX/Sxy family transcriptional regulator of competence genes
MAYNLKLAERIRSKLDGIPVVEKNMFGGVGFLLNGNMACGVNKNDFIVRIDPKKYDALLKKSYVRPFDMTGRPMKGWLVVEAEGVKTANQLSLWIKQGIEFASTLPPK